MWIRMLTVSHIFIHNISNNKLYFLKKKKKVKLLSYKVPVHVANISSNVYQ